MCNLARQVYTTNGLHCGHNESYDRLLAVLVQLDKNLEDSVGTQEHRVVESDCERLKRKVLKVLHESVPYVSVWRCCNALVFGRFLALLGQLGCPRFLDEVPGCHGAGDHICPA